MNWIDELTPFRLEAIGLDPELVKGKSFIHVHAFVWFAMMQDPYLFAAFKKEAEPVDVPGFGRLVGRIHGIPVYVGA